MLPEGFWVKNIIYKEESRAWKIKSSTKKLTIILEIHKSFILEP